MDTEDLKAVVVKLAAIAQRLDERSAAAVQHVEQAGALLDQRAQLLASGSGQFTREVSQALQQRSTEMIGQGVGEAVVRFNQQIEASARTAQSAADALDRERNALARERRTVLWLGCGALLTGCLLAVGASAYAVRSSRTEVQRNRMDAALLEAYNRADVVPCGRGLCANIDDAAARVGDRKQYRVIKAR